MLESIQNEELEYQKISPEEQQRRGILGRLVGICADFIDPTRNGRHYSEQLWEKTFNDPIMKERIENGVCFGELCHPTDREETDMEKIAVCLPEVPKKGKDGKLRAVFDILDTPNGRILKTLCDYGSKLGVSSRGSGDTYTGMDGNEEVDPDSYTCQGFDIVLIPAVKAARLQYVTESLGNKKSLRESLQDMVNSASDADRKVMEETLGALQLDESETEDPVRLMDKFWSECKALVKKEVDYDAAWGNMWHTEYRVQPACYRNVNRNSLSYKMEFHDAEVHSPFYEKTVKPAIEHAVDYFNSNYPELSSMVTYREEVNKKTGDPILRFILNLSEGVVMSEALNESTKSDLKDTVKETIDYIKDYFPFEPKEWYGFSNWEEVAENIDYNIGDLEETAEGLIAELNASIKATERIAKHSKLDPEVDFTVTEDPDYEIEKDLRDELQRALGCTSLTESRERTEINPTNNLSYIHRQSDHGEYDYYDLGYIDRVKCSATYYYTWSAGGRVEENFCDVRTLHPYNDAKYHWARSDGEGTNWKIVLDGKVVEKFTSSPMDFVSVAKHLIELDNQSKIKPRMMYEEVEDSTSSFNIEDDSEKEAVGDDEALLEELQKALRKNQDLEQEIITLNEKLSVCYAKEDRAKVKNDAFKNSIKKLTQKSSQAAALQRKVDTLQESLSKSESNREKLEKRLEKTRTTSNSLTEQLKKGSNEKATLTKKLLESNSTIQKLEEQVAELTKDLHQTKQNYLAKLDKSNRLVEKYKATTQGVVDKYISSQALKLGVKPEEVKNRLPESYSMSDIDEVCEELQSYKLNLSKLPFTTMPGLREGLQMKANPSKQKDLASVNTDDLVDEQLMSLMGLK